MSPFQTCNLTGKEKLEKKKKNPNICRSAKKRQNKGENGSLSEKESLQE